MNGAMQMQRGLERYASQLQQTGDGLSSIPDRFAWLNGGAD